MIWTQTNKKEVMKGISFWEFGKEILMGLKDFWYLGFSCVAENLRVRLIGSSGITDRLYINISIWARAYVWVQGQVITLHPLFL